MRMIYNEYEGRKDTKEIARNEVKGIITVFREMMSLKSFMTLGFDMLAYCRLAVVI